VRFDGAAVSYARLDETTGRTAALLIDQGLRAGDRVALVLPAALESAVLYWAVLRAGGVVIPLDPRLPPLDLERRLRSCAPQRAFIGSEDHEAAEAVTGAGIAAAPVTSGGFDDLSIRPVREPLEVDSRDTAVIVCAEGQMTTLSHGRIARRARKWARLAQLVAQDVVLSCRPSSDPFVHADALHACCLAGASLTLVSGASAQEVTTVFSQSQATVLTGPRGFFRELRESIGPRYQPGSVRLCLCEEEFPLPAGELREYEEAFDCRVVSRVPSLISAAPGVFRLISQTERAATPA
jgi:long-chain acyl-CoA synthetase